MVARCGRLRHMGPPTIGTGHGPASDNRDAHGGEPGWARLREAGGPAIEGWPGWFGK